MPTPVLVVSRAGLARACALRGRVHRIERLARGHEQAVALGAAEADVAAHFGQPDAAEELAVRRPRRHAAIADGAARIAGGPDIAVDVTAHTVRPALHTVDHALAEPLLVGELVVAADVEHENLALAAGPGVAGSLAGGDDVDLLEVRREAQPGWIWHLLLGDDEVDTAARIDAIAIGRQLAPARCEAGRLSNPWIELAAGIARTARGVGRPFVERPAIGRMGEPLAAVRMRDDVVRRVQLLAVVIVAKHGRGAVMFITRHPPGQMFAGKLTALEIERVAVGIVGRRAEHADATVVFAPAHLPVVGNVAP